MRRVGPHHFAYLRAVAEGIAPQDAAKRFLGIAHGHEAITAHRATVDLLRAAARRHGEKSARLIGLTIKTTQSDKPSLDDFIAENDLDGWSEVEITQMYEAAFGSDSKVERRNRMRERQLELLKRLEAATAQAPSPSDFVGGWFDEALAQKFVGAGINTLGELNLRVSAGGSWYKNLPAVGQNKAQRIEHFLRALLPRLAVALPHFGHPKTSGPTLPATTLPALPGSLLGALSLEESVTAWIEAKAGSVATRKVYAREVGRFLVWLRIEHPGTTPANLTIQEAIQFSGFLENIPDHYISRRKAAPGKLGWAPFRGQLTPSSRKQSLVVVGAWLDWLVHARHISANPFRLISKKQGDNPADSGEVKAISEGAMKELLAFFDAIQPSPAAHRMRFLLRFLESMGLRASELLQARVSDLVTLPEGLALHVHGKGSKNRRVTLNRQAREALNEYLTARGIGTLQTAPAEAPLFASVRNPMEPISYSTLYGTVKRWLTKAVSASPLASHEKCRLQLASTHWLRHTFGTRLIEKGAAPDAVQSSMGHASPVTLAKYTRASAKRQFTEISRIFGE